MEHAEHCACSVEEALETGNDALRLSRMYDELPEELFSIPNLRELRLDHCHMDVPARIADISTIEVLEINSMHDIREFLKEIHRMTSLKKLRLSWVDGLRDGLPDSFGELTNLEALYFDSANFPGFPKIIGSLPKLTSLTVKYCGCDPADIIAVASRTGRLRKLSLERSQGTAIPESIADLPDLEILDLNSCVHLKSLPDNLGVLRGLRTLDLSIDPDHAGEGCLERLPDSLADLENLEVLNLHNCVKLASLPPGFGRLHKLRFLDVRMTAIRNVPLSPEQLAGLEALNVQGEFPDLAACPKLKELSYVRLSVTGWRMPESEAILKSCDDEFVLPFTCPPQLEDLTIVGGVLKDTDFLGDLPNLRHLHLHCDLESLSERIGNLTELETFSTWGSFSLTSFPESITKLDKLEELYFNGHPFVHMPEMLLSMPNLFFIEWNDEVHQRDAERKHEEEFGFDFLHHGDVDLSHIDLGFLDDELDT